MEMNALHAVRQPVFHSTRMLFASALLILAILAPGADAQATFPAAFLANNGNLEGSVTSFRYNADGSLAVVEKEVTGARSSTSVYEPGCNAYTIAISPNGHYLATGHASSDDPLQQVTILEAAADATLSIVVEYPHPDTAMDVEWLTDEYLAATRTEYGAQNYIVLYRFDAEAETLTPVDSDAVGTFTTSLALHPSRQYLYAGDSSSPNRIFVLEFHSAGSLSLKQTVSTGSTYPLGVSVSPNGKFLYAAGGISGGGHAVLGYGIQADGTLTVLGGSPFSSPGSSPKDFTFSSDSAYLFVGHGSDSTVRSFTINPETGAIAATGYSFSVGIQGELGDLYVSGDYLLVSDNFYGATGLYSFDVLPNGNFTMNGTLVNSLGIGPREITAWIPPAPCPGDADGDRDVDLSDLAALLSAYGTCPGDANYIPGADLDGVECVTLADLAELLAHYGVTCP
jgi:6-phosphogluconolactonase (cycloisomerase 2 family)